MRQIMLDTETTGIKVAQGHRVIEIGCVEVIDRQVTGKTFHQYLNPERDIEEGALEVHGLDRDFLSDKPLFADIVDDFLAFVDGAELVIHNAPFDVGFLDNELILAGRAERLQDRCQITDSLEYARRKHPGARNSLDALCKRYRINSEHRTLHGALLDAQLLADVYLAMTGGQVSLALDAIASQDDDIALDLSQLAPAPVVRATPEEIKAHEAWLDAASAARGEPFLWQKNAKNHQ
jgi:DNA polymerase-3 subunit epsilon